jgi:hypothetical protein
MSLIFHIRLHTNMTPIYLQSAAMLSAPVVLLASMTIPSTSATPLLLRVLGAVQLYGVAAAYTLKVCELTLT